MTHTTIIDTRRGAAVLVTLLLAALFSLLVLPPLDTPVITKPTGEVKQPPIARQVNECGDINRGPYFYTYEEPKESKHAFGPKVRPQHVMDELKNRLCGYRTPGGAPVGGDWSLLLALQGIVDGTDPNRQLTLSQWQEEVLDFTDRVDWDVYRIVREDTPRESPYTLYMTGKKGKQPTIHASRVERQRPSTYLLISVREKDGDIAKLRLRLECGFQPVFLHIETAPKALR